MANNLHLRTLEKDDLTFLHKLFNNPEVMNYWFSESYMSMEQLKESFDKDKDNPRNREFVLTNGNEESLGFVGLFDIEQRHRNAEFAIMIDPLHQGNGYAGPATELAMDYAFSVLNLHKLYLIVAKTNEKAGHIYEKAGFQAEGKMMEHFFVNGEYLDGILMCIFQRDYWESASQKK
ncbi:GNAT family N-acetyltransferase [Lentibacillus amyloliquefaciens]|uniref:Spermidine acetyltransferase n=1 Tax=Lentibacillus amyloliquefaciens TaxID=1472767 RepID=A0A0U3WK67_9BACI|nr:GNAT family N-acetyltransferase [Lentibacillus amyloliquefaciens]ALX50223.1 spermidine acetyltransferase [Lentibacillus amyloliquefaciens]